MGGLFLWQLTDCTCVRGKVMERKVVSRDSIKAAALPRMAARLGADRVEDTSNRERKRMNIKTIGNRKS